MEVRDKVRSVSTRRPNNQNLPALRSSTLVSKTIVALSKVDIDSRNIYKDKPVRTTATLEKEKEHLRSQSGFNLRKSKDLPPDPKPLTKTQVQLQNPSQFKLSFKDIKQQDQIAVANPVIIDKAKISSKSYGTVKAYSANSHPGPILSYNEDRICIVTNLTKTSVKQKQVSFFGVYDGNNGVARADYLRDNFHLTLAAEQIFPNDMQSALRLTLRKVNKAFSEDPRFNGDESNVGFVIIVTFNDEMHYLQSGNCKAVFSSHLGSNIYFPTKTETIILNKQPSKGKVGQMRKGRGKETIEVQYRKLMREDQLDFVLLGSEGVFENMKIRDIGKRVWLYLLRNKQESIHFAIGEANNLLLSDVFSLMGTKNSSLIITAFESITLCLQGIDLKDNISLPHVGKDLKQ